MPYSLYRPVGSCSSGLIRSVSLPIISPASHTASSSSHPYHPIYPLYSCIFVSFIYIAYIIFIIYINRRDMISPTPIIQIKQRRPASRPAASNRASGTRQEQCPQEQEAGDDEPNMGTHRMMGMKQARTPITSTASSHRQARREPSPISPTPR